MEKITAANEGLKKARELHESEYEAEMKKLDAKEKHLFDRLKQLDENKTKVAEANGDVDATDDDLVEINAGGKTLAVSRSTLTQFKGTMLEALFSGRWDKLLTRDSAGRIFLDANPVCFQAIVDYLNDAKISTEDNPATPPKVDSEYQDILMHQLDLFGLTDVVFPVKLPDSKIIEDVSQAKQLHSWLDEDGCGGELTLLYCSTRDGRNDSTFHSKCDNKGPTLTVIETTDGHIVGGYSDVHWNGALGNYQSSNKAFLFAMAKTNDFSPSKMKLTGSSNQNATYHRSSDGPTFGGGHDLKVQGQYVYLSNRYTYQTFPSPMQPQSYIIKEMEVFQAVSHPPNIPVSTKNKSKKKACKNSKKDIAMTNNEASSPFQVQKFSFGVNVAINQKWKTFAEVESEVDALEASFGKEKKLISFVSSNGKSHGVIVLNVCGTPMATTRHTLEMCKESTLSAKILDKKDDNDGANQKPVNEWNTEDVVAWLNNIDGLESSVIRSFEEDEVTGRELISLGKEGLRDFGVKKRGTIFYLLSEIEKLKTSQGDVPILIEHSPYCFEKIIDHLRLEDMFVKGLTEHKVGLPVVRESEKSRFEKVVKHYFPGDSSKALLGE